MLTAKGGREKRGERDVEEERDGVTARRALKRETLDISVSMKGAEVVEAHIRGVLCRREHSTRTTLLLLPSSQGGPPHGSKFQRARARSDRAFSISFVDRGLITDPNNLGYSMFTPAAKTGTKDLVGVTDIRDTSS